jgi:choline dehydrogenase-like flavoprotein
MYDYVIVGAGSAGCVLAARLGEVCDVRVAVIEAGPPDSEPVIHMPWAYLQLFESRFDWGLWSEPEPELGCRRELLPRGHVLGGSSSLNAMIHMRGNRADYDGWAAMGFAGWGYEDVLPYFRRAEDNERGESYYHGVGGPLAVSDGRSMHPLVGAFIEAAVETGVAPTGDHNGPAQEGAGWFQFTQRNDATPVPCGTGPHRPPLGPVRMGRVRQLSQPFPLVLGQQAPVHLHLRGDGDRVRPGQPQLAAPEG